MHQWNITAIVHQCKFLPLKGGGTCLNHRASDWLEVDKCTCLVLDLVKHVCRLITHKSMQHEETRWQYGSQNWSYLGFVTTSKSLCVSLPQQQLPKLHERLKSLKARISPAATVLVGSVVLLSPESTITLAQSQKYHTKPLHFHDPRPAFPPSADTKNLLPNPQHQ